MRVERFEWDGAEAERSPSEIRDLDAALGEVADDVAAIDPRGASTRGDEAVLRADRRASTRPSARRERCGSTRTPSSTAALDALDPGAARGAASSRPRTSAPSPRPSSTPSRSDGRAAAGPDASTSREVAGRRRRRLRARAAGPPIPRRVLMCAIPARVAGVERVALASPPGPDGTVSPLVLAAAALCGVDEVYAMGGAQAIVALAYGTETVAAVDVIAGPGNALRPGGQARGLRRGSGSTPSPGPSELMVVAGHDTEPEWAALDLCAQAEHGADSLLVASRSRSALLDAIAERGRAELAAERPSVADAPLALVQVPDTRRRRSTLANALAPEHLELMSEDAALLADRVDDRRLRLRRPPRRHRLRRLRRRLQPRAADRRRRRASRARSAPAPSGAGSRWSRSPAEAAAALAAARRRARPRRGLPGPRRVGASPIRSKRE